MATSKSIKNYLDMLQTWLEGYFSDKLKIDMYVDIYDPQMSGNISMPAMLIDDNDMTISDAGIEEYTAELNMSVFVLVGRGEKDKRSLYLIRDIAIDTMRQMKHNNFQSEWIGFPENMRAEKTEFELSGALECIEIKWIQTLNLDGSIWDNYDFIRPQTVYVGQNGDYVNVT